MIKINLSFLILVLILSINSLFAQEKTEMSIVLLSNQTLTEVNINEERFLNYTQKVIAELNLIFENDKTPRDIVVLFKLKKDTIPEIDISARPALPADKVEMIIARLRKFRHVNTKFIDFSFLYQIYTHGGYPNDDLAFSPEIKNPFVIAEKEFEEASLGLKVELLKKWAITEVLPILSAFEKKADNQFKGVRISGDQIAAINYDTIINVKELTDYNPYYWRGVMEMSIDNFLVMATKVFLHVAQGEFDKARRYQEILSFFKKDKTVADYYSDELQWRLNSFYTALNHDIEKGCLLYDKGKYYTALGQYSSTSVIYPNSAWLNYEIFVTNQAIESERENDSTVYAGKWTSYKKEVYNCDPLYPMDLYAQNDKEAWLLFRRKEISNLFQPSSNTENDFVNYADIAMDLEAWDFAAHMYWLIFTHFSEADYGKEKNILAYYLYCLDKLGQNDILLLFDLNYDKEFKKIEKERITAMEENEAYKAFHR